MKNVLITGASSGIGLAIGNCLQNKGYHVIGTSRTPEADNKKLEKFEMVALDVCDEMSVTRCVKEVTERAGGIDILINNAGYAVVGSAEETHTEQLQKQFDTNFFGITRMVRAVLPHMRHRRGGQIINISSLAGFAAIPYTAAYSASKFAVDGYSEALYHELLPLGIRVSVVQPGMVKTDFFEHSHEIENTIQDYSSWHRAAIQEIGKHTERGIVAKEVAKAILTLCETENPTFINRVGSDAKLVARLKRFLPKAIFNRIWHREFGLAAVKATS